MEVEILSSEKDEVEVKVDNLTIAEILRVYLSENTDFVAWKRDQPGKPPIMKIKSDKGTVKKAVSDAISEIRKDLDKFQKELK